MAIREVSDDYYTQDILGILMCCSLVLRYNSVLQVRGGKAAPFYN